MAYLNNIPQPTDILSNSQAQLLENFAQLESQFSIDHDSLLAAGATGKHLKLTLPEQAVDPTTAVNEGAVYTKDSGTQTELYYREENNGDVIQLTSNGASNSFIKAFCSIDNTGAILGTSYNIASVVRNGNGDYTLNFTVAMADANYLVIGNAVIAARRSRVITTYSKAAGSCRILETQGTDAAANDSIDVMIIRIS